MNTCYEAVVGFKEKDSVKGRRSRPGAFCKKGAFKARIHCGIFLSDYFMKCVFHDSLFHCVNYRGMSVINFLRHFMKYKNSENPFSEFSLSWKTLLLNLFPCLINPFAINGVYKSLKEKVSITWKASEVVFVFWKAVVQRCSVKKILKKEPLGQVFFFFIEHLWWLLLYFTLQNLKDTEDRLE